MDPSSLTKFRKLRLKDMNLLDMLIAKTVQIALEKKHHKINIHYCGCNPYEIKVQPENAKTGASKTVKETAARCL